MGYPSVLCEVVSLQRLWLVRRSVLARPQLGSVVGVKSPLGNPEAGRYLTSESAEKIGGALRDESAPGEKWAKGHPVARRS